MDTETLQRDHFNQLITAYEKHYDDKYSRQYREKFINQYLFRGIDLCKKNVLEGMCGSGQTTEYLLDKGADVTCLDISGRALDILKSRFKTVKVLKASIKKTGLNKDMFDCVVMVGGLHHVHPDINQAIDETYRLLKPGGYLCFFEPHQGSWPDAVRKFWYKRDRYFASNERSIDIQGLKKIYKNKFSFKKEYYSGNLAYIFVYNSLIIRAPRWLKAAYSSIFLKLESLLRVFQGKRFSCFVICQWQKK